MHANLITRTRTDSCLSVVFGKHLKNPRNEHMEFSHVVAQELLGGSGRDLTAVRDQARRKVDIGLGSIHLGRVAKAEHAAQVLLGDGRPDRARRCADDSGRDRKRTRLNSSHYCASPMPYSALTNT